MFCRFKEILPLLARVPVLPCLITRQLSQARQQGVVSLLDWISAQVNTAVIQPLFNNNYSQKEVNIPEYNNK